MFGSDPAYVQANDPFALAAKNADAIRGKTVVRIAVGDQDSLKVRNQALHELLGQLKIDHEYELVPGVAHNGNLFYTTLGDVGQVPDLPSPERKNHSELSGF